MRSVSQAPLLELLENSDGKDDQAEYQAQHMDQYMPLPVPVLLPALEEKLCHSQLGEGESDENVNRIHDHHPGDGTSGVKEQQNSGASHK